jgi:hypothetical protein
MSSNGARAQDAQPSKLLFSKRLATVVVGTYEPASRSEGGRSKLAMRSGMSSSFVAAAATASPIDGNASAELIETPSEKAIVA